MNILVKETAFNITHERFFLVIKKVSKSFQKKHRKSQRFWQWYDTCHTMCHRLHHQNHVLLCHSLSHQTTLCTRILGRQLKEVFFGEYRGVHILITWYIYTKFSRDSAFLLKKRELVAVSKSVRQKIWCDFFPFFRHKNRLKCILKAIHNLLLKWRVSSSSSEKKNNQFAKLNWKKRLPIYNLVELLCSYYSYK